MKVGILTYHRAINYGAYLQACALCGRLNEEADIEAELIDFQMIREVKKYAYNWPFLARIRHFQKFRFLRSKKQAFLDALNDPVMARSADYCRSDSLEDFTAFVKGKYDAIVAGSDEIWNFRNFRGFPNPYWLIGDLGCRKFSYAASSRQDFSTLPEESLKIIRDTLREFEYIGVRDELTADQLKKVLPELDFHLCCDPSFIHDFRREKKPMKELMSGNSQYDPGKGSAVVMSDNAALNSYLYQKLHKTYNMISVTDYNPRYINLPEISPLKWMDLINSADIVFTTYFHGSCFSIIQKTPFISFTSAARGSKVSRLLMENGFRDNYVSNAEAFVKEDCLRVKMDELLSADRLEGFYDRCGSYVDTCRDRFAAGFLKQLKNG